ncbi:MAG: Fic family protein [Sphaerochaetaceae bacterium]|nr:Fic family protein [Sphaerochaetaceae bacterium]
MEKRAGSFKSNLYGEMAYQSFLPAPLPPNPPVMADDEMMGLLVQANTWIAKLESIASLIPHIALFVSMYVRKEALMSSQIEGTQCTLEDVLDPTVESNANRDVADVINYIKATDYAIKRLKELPLCNRLIRETHAVLMEEVRGEEKSPGQFRISQNWIGGKGVPLKNARFIPPHPDDMVVAMSDLEKYMNAPDTLDVLVRAALIHYQFETIHPFLDGNGRIGRLLITLFLLEQKSLTTPALYISYFLKKNRMEYYDRLTLVRTKGDYEQWIKFFLKAVFESAQDAHENIVRLAKLHDKHVERINAVGRARFTALQLFSYLERNPIMEIKGTAQALQLSFNTVASAVKRLVDIGILVQSGGNQRSRTFSYKEYLDILREGT